MVQRRGRAGFLLESMEAIGVGRKRRRQHFDGDVATEPCVARLVDLAHAAGAEGSDDSDAAEVRTWSETQ